MGRAHGFAVGAALGVFWLSGANVRPLTSPIVSRVDAATAGQLAYTVRRGRMESIALRALAGGAIRLVKVPSFRGKPVSVGALAWDPSARRLAFSDSANRVFTVDADGRRLRRVTTPALAANRFLAVDSWSPDGRTLAVKTGRGACAAGEPGLYVVRVDTKRVTRLAVRPRNSPTASSEHPAFIGDVAWSPDGSDLAYAWQQYDDGECRIGGGDRPTIVATIGADGSGRRELLHQSVVFDIVWSPSGRSLAIASMCGDEEPLAWDGEYRVVIATTYQFCTVIVVDREGKHRRGAELDPSESYSRSTGTVLYSIDAVSGAEHVLRKLGVRTWSDAIGTLPHGGGVVAIWNGGPQLRLLPLDGSALVALPPLTVPRGMKLRGLAAAAAPVTSRPSSSRTGHTSERSTHA